MKIIDQTPYYDNETGEISMVNRVKATLKYGGGWTDEIEAQKSVVSVLDGVLDKNHILIRNVTPPGLEARIPFILIGPSGVYVIYVAHLTGTYRAKGDQWGTISGNTFKPSKPNLLTRTERMAKAIQVYLQRHGYADLTTVDGILLCTDPGIHVDSLRPIVRVIMRDALERFAVSLTQAHALLSPEAVRDISNQILIPPKPAAAKQEALSAAEAAASAEGSQPKPTQNEEAYIPPFAMPDSQGAAGSAETWNADRMGFDFTQPSASQTAASQPSDASSQPFATQPSADFPQEAFPAQPGMTADSLPEVTPPTPVRMRRGVTRGQLVFLIVMTVVELLILAAFGYIIITNFL